MPPSAITGTPASAAAFDAAMIAVSCGTPTPATIRVVQIDPGPIPTLIASAPAPASALRRLGGGDVAGDDLDLVRHLLDPLDRARDLDIMAVRGVDDDAVDPGVDQRLAAREAGIADGRGGGDAQPPFAVLGRVRAGDGLFDVLDGDQPDAMVGIVDDQQFLDPPAGGAAHRAIAGRRRGRFMRRADHRQGHRKGRHSPRTQPRTRGGRLRVAAASTIAAEGFERAEALIDAECRLIIIDTAHGHNVEVARAVERVKKMSNQVQSSPATSPPPRRPKALAGAGADAIKVGIGPGSICTTRIVTGVGVPQLSAIMAASKQPRTRASR